MEATTRSTLRHLELEETRGMLSLSESVNAILDSRALSRSVIFLYTSASSRRLPRRFLLIKPIRFSICRTLLLVLIFSSAALASERDFCSSSNAFSLGEHAPKPSLGIRLFELNVRPEFPMRIMEHLRIYLAENLRARLSESQ